MVPYTKVIIYYFTGTGNALLAGRWICEKASELAITAELHSIDRGYTPDSGVTRNGTLVGFLFPTHGFNAAPSMLKFLWNFPRGRGAHAFVLNTRAGSKVFSLLGPGVSGLAQILPMSILALKGYGLRGGLPLDMPSNWISLHPGYGDRWISFIIARCETITKDFAHAVLTGRRRFFRALITLPLDCALVPIAVAYYLIGRFMLAKTFIYSSACNTCMVCVNNCPVGAIEIMHGRPYWKFTCESCMRCINNCPREAVQVSHLFFLIIILVAKIPLVAYLFTAMPFLAVIAHRPVVFFLNAYVTLLSVFFLYGALQWMLRFKAVNALFTYTSLTRYWRRYRAPGTGPKDYRPDRAMEAGKSSIDGGFPENTPAVPEHRI